MTCHHVVAPLVHRADDLGEGRGVSPCKYFQFFGHRLGAQATVDDSSPLLPEAAKHAVSIVRTLHDRTRQAVLGAIPAIAARESHPVGSRPVRHRQADTVLVAAATAGGEPDLIVNVEVDRHRVRNDIHRVGQRIWTEHEIDRLEIDQQRVRHDVVRAQVLTVERAGVNRLELEIGVVDDHITADAGEASLAQVALKEPQTLRDQIWIAVSLDIQIARQHPIAQVAPEVGLGIPSIGGAQFLQREKGRQQLDRRGRIAGLILIYRE